MPTFPLKVITALMSITPLSSKTFRDIIGIYVYGFIFVVTSFALICSWLYILGNPYPELGLILLKLK